MDKEAWRREFGGARVAVYLSRAVQASPSVVVMASPALCGESSIFVVEQGGDGSWNVTGKQLMWIS